MDTLMHHPLVEQYVLTCQHEGCGASRVIQQLGSAGLVLGTLIPKSSDPDYGRCLRCKRYVMKVTAGPPPPEASKPIGFTRIPSK
jgi:hypothetical protein